MAEVSVSKQQVYYPPPQAEILGVSPKEVWFENCDFWRVGQRKLTSISQVLLAERIMGGIPPYSICGDLVTFREFAEVKETGTSFLWEKSKIFVDGGGSLSFICFNFAIKCSLSNQDIKINKDKFKASQESINKYFRNCSVANLKQVLIFILN